MAQVTEVFQSEKGDKKIIASNEDVAVAAAAGGSSLLELDVHGCDRLFARIKNTHATVAFDDFQVWAKATLSANDDWVNVTAEGDIVLAAVSTTLAAETAGFLLLNTRGIAQIKLVASANTSAGTASAFASAH